MSACAITSVLIGQTLGKLIAYAWLAIDTRLRAHYCPEKATPMLPGAAVIFYDKSYIENLQHTL